MPSTDATFGGGKSGTATRWLRLRADVIDARIPAQRTAQAERLGISTATLSRWLGGRSREGAVMVNQRIAERVAETLGVGFAEAWVDTTTADQLHQHRTRKREVARLGAHSRWAGGTCGAGHAGQEGLRAALLRQVDPDGTLPPEQLARCEEHALRAHMARIRLKRHAA
jgi:hypothetical protein